MEPVYYVSIIAQFLTYASFLSGAKVCHLIYIRKSCAKLSAVPFLAGLGCATLWLRYGFVADEWEIISVNVIAVCCQLIYLSFFAVYSKQRLRLFKQTLSLTLFVGAMIWLIEHTDDPLFLAGSLASAASLVACAAPMATIGDVLATKCSASLPFPIIASSFVVSLSWLLFGYLKEDNFILFTNIVAVSISGAQLSLFMIFPSTLPYEKLSQSNKKSYDLIRLLNADDEHLDQLDPLEESSADEVDVNQDYKEVLTRIMNQIYSQRQQLSKKTGAIMLLLATG